METVTRKKTALELVQAYVSYKEQRQKDKTKSETNINRTSTHIFAELPAALQIRHKSSSVESLRPASTQTGDKRQTSETRKCQLETPVINAFTKSTRELAKRVELFNQQLLSKNLPTRTAAEHHGGQNHETERQRHAMSGGNLSDVLEEDEQLESYRNARPREIIREKEPESIRSKAISGSQRSRSVDGSETLKISGNSKMGEKLDNIQRLQEANKILVRHLKKMMRAYRELSLLSEAAGKSFSSRLLVLTESLQNKDSQILKLQEESQFLTHRLQEANQNVSDEISRTQIVEVKLSQALSKISKLTNENENLKATSTKSSARSEIDLGTERTLMRRIMELEAELALGKSREAEIQDLNARLEARDEKIRLLSNRGATMVKQLHSSDAEKQFSEQTIAIQEELKKAKTKIILLETAVEENVRELRETKHELEDKTWRLERLQKDVEKLSKEKDRAFEKTQEFEQEIEEKRRADKVEWDKKCGSLEEQLGRYKGQLKDAEKQLARAKVQQEEFGVRYRELERVSKEKVDTLLFENRKYQDQLDQITAEFLTIDQPVLKSG